ncbi:hypothetical protein VTJ83DRAFT_5969 [Remersonia thermophila]|uniref:Uncharacterized protein n=1 Tax=Remersonia thermophila TaxID=72144 RepID=A0ABR4D8D0_9PEZI
METASTGTRDETRGPLSPPVAPEIHRCTTWEQCRAGAYLKYMNVPSSSRATVRPVGNFSTNVPTLEDKPARMGDLPERSGSMEEAAINNHDYFTLKDAPVENLRPLRVVVIGAGFSGILAAIRIPERLRNVELIVYEKNEDVGGVWWLNKYPAHSYQYSFAPNPNWTSLYAPGSEIQQYLRDVAEKYGATRFIKTRHRVDCCEWNDAEKKWMIRVKNLATGETILDAANVLISARGQLNDISWPDIPGLFSKFLGKVMHPGNWDTSHDLRNKRIGIIGNGSSAIQIIPQLQKIEGASLTCFIRSPTWISVTPEQRQNLTADPSLLFKFRKAFETSGNLVHEATLRGTPMQRSLEAALRQAMETKLASRPDLRALLIPPPGSFAPGCRRLTPGPGFLEALLAPNVTVVGDAILEATEDGLVTASRPSEASGEQAAHARHRVDVLISSTGYHAGRNPRLYSAILGRRGLPLSARWGSRPETYLSLAVDGFPNLLLLFGPNGAIGAGSLTRMLEASVDYAVRFVRKLQREDYACGEVRSRRVRDFMAYVDRYFEQTVYDDECGGWYKSKCAGADGQPRTVVTGLWPGSTLHAIETMRSPRWEDWAWESVEGNEGNGLRWLGNGMSVTQLGEGDPSWYINEDQVEVPVEGKPEENARWRARPWCY